MSEIGADVDGFLSRVWVAMAGVKKGIEEMDRGEGKGKDEDKSIEEF